jgi:hypothetical protein
MSMLLLSLVAMLQNATPTPVPPLEQLIEGTYTNEEQVYFERDAGRTRPPWQSIRIVREGSALLLQRIDAFGTVSRSYPVSVEDDILTIGTCSAAYRQIESDIQQDGSDWYIMHASAGCDSQGENYLELLPEQFGRSGLRMHLPGDGLEATIRMTRARPFTCWVSVRRYADRDNGEADWSFDRGLAIHDQGGRVLVQPEGAPPVVIRMRNVVWPPPSANRPSLVLYVHRPESPDRAESYSWADPDARMVGINLRWVQASCSRA